MHGNLMRLLLGGLLSCAATARADFEILVDNSAIVETAQVLDYNTTGAHMAGMIVTAHFKDGSYESKVWAKTGKDSGAALGWGWSLSQSGTTFSQLEEHAWVLRSHPGSLRIMDSLTIDAIAGNVAFDRILSLGNEGTPGSQSGRRFWMGASDPFPNKTIVATYSNPVALTGSSPAGDLYGRLEINLEQIQFNSLLQLKFWADTDNTFGAQRSAFMSFSAVPEPSATLLIFVGMQAWLWRRRYDG